MSHLAIALYIGCNVIVTTYIVAYSVLLIGYLLYRRTDPALPLIPDDQLPPVTVQLPIYNEAYVVERVIHACAKLDYPADKLVIQILDDSTDHTQQIIRDVVDTLPDVQIEIIHRDQRDGYKAGALHTAPVKTPFVAIFDADFIPPPDFLRQTMPHLRANPNIAMIQTRWGHLNPDTNSLTHVQTLNIDAHFAIEQVARYHGKLPMSMNGTGAIWREAVIRDCGGWQSDTLTEDLDLSYRAQIRGYQFLYLRDVVVDGELTPQLQAYKIQQARWATGSTQCLMKHTPTLWRSPHLSILQKFMGTMHLGQYAIQPVLLLLFLLTPYIIGTDHHLPNIKILSLIGIVPPLMIVLGQFALYEDWYKRLRYFPVQLIIGAGIVVSNSLAVFKGLSRGVRIFERTPKFQLTQNAHHWQNNRYRLSFDRVIVVEIVLLIYAIWGVSVASANEFYAFIPYLLIYVVSFSYFVLRNLYEAR